MKWIIVAALALSGCVASNLADVIEKAGKDPASICIKIGTVYGTVDYMRSNPPVSNDVTCGPFSIKSTTNMSIPMTITPQFNIQGGSK